MAQAQPFIRYTMIVLLAGVLLALPNGARADGDDQERARQAMLAGEVRPLTELLAHVESMYEGDIIEVELESDDNGAWYETKGEPLFLYEIKLLTPQGNLVKLEFNAKNLELLTVDGHDSESARKGADNQDD